MQARPPLFRGWRLLLLVALASLIASPASADNLLVHNNANSGSGSLRQAVNDSNATSGTNTIVFSNTVTGTITLATELVISTNATILGPGPNVLTVSGNNSTRVFNVTGGTVSISGLTIANGRSIGGGGISSLGNLYVSNCLFLANNSTTGSGGALSSTSNATVERCAFVNNTATGNGGALNLIGAAIVNNCTIVSNTAISSIPMVPSATGGGIYSSGGSNVIVASCTISSNLAGGPLLRSGGGLGGSAIVRNTVIAGNTAQGGQGQDAYGTFTSQGYNLIGKTDGSTGWGGVGDQLGTTNSPINPNLAPLGNYGGQTPTMPPLSGSLTIDQGKSFGLTYDQRGRPRTHDQPILNATLGDGTDIGAVEVGALTLVVSNSNDSGPGSLRQAVLDASPLEPDTISFVPNVTNTITLTSGEIVINKYIDMTGPGANRLSISGNGNSRIFSVQNGGLNLVGLTLTNGNAAAGLLGGNLLILSPIQVVMEACRVTHGQAGEGGGIWNAGVLTMFNCTVDGNTATGAAGGLANDPSGTVSALNCTIASNSSGDQNGVAIFNNGYLTLNSCTVAGNTVSLPAGRAIRDQNTAVIANTIIASNTFGNGTDVSGSFTSLGYNLIEVTTDSTGFGATGDQFNVNPLLGPLGNYGGPTPTMALRSGSPAIDKGKNSFPLMADQRAFQRPLDDVSIPNAPDGDGSDIGAYEADPRFRIVNLSRVGNDVGLSLTTMLGRNYRAEYTSNLTSVIWPVFTNDAPGNGHLLWVTNFGGANQPRRFYRSDNSVD